MIITDELKARLDRVLTFYDSQGVPLSYVPKVEYRDQPCKTMPLAGGAARVEEEFRRKTASFIQTKLGQLSWRELYGLEVSLDAVVELAEALNKRSIKFPMQSDFDDTDADILLFPSYAECTDLQRDVTLAHEVWHLIEKERGVIDSAPLIIEGTATYAMKRFAGKQCKRTLDECDELFELLYLGCAWLVQERVLATANPYLAMLDLDIRDRVQADTLTRSTPQLLRLTAKSRETKTVQTAMASIVRQFPEFLDLQGRLMPENVIGAYRKIGAVLLAEELQGQDLTKLIGVYKLIGF